jgi:hypothetical protein
MPAKTNRSYTLCEYLGIPVMVRLYATAGRRHALRLQVAPGNT